jgi:hypothetical protein
LHPCFALVLQIHGTCLGFQLLHILVSNVSRNDLLVETDSVSHPTTLLWPADGAEKRSRMFGTLPVRMRCSTCASMLHFAGATMVSLLKAGRTHMQICLC